MEIMRSSAPPCMPIAVGEGIELLEIAQGMVRLAFDPRTQARLQGAMA